MEYKIKDLCNKLDFGVSKFYNLKKVLDYSVPEQNRIKYYYNKGRNFYITEEGFNWFKNYIDNNSNSKIRQNSTNSDINVYQNQIIDIYKQRIEYLEQENKRLLDILSVKEQKELAKDIKYIGDSETMSFWGKLFHKFKK